MTCTGSKLSAGLFDLASFATCKFDELRQGSVKFDLKFTLKNGGKFQNLRRAKFDSKPAEF
ncbi:hypothetical protein [uncultured Campylobacter sp.]|uniref:hypothetical protein n=1 Tax=uncultured Campylobacter sp. TaxID=218934 RepID=UPI00260F490B|nr:hypothetical protein [uncultured Campylobacter sp.]